MPISFCNEIRCPNTLNETFRLIHDFFQSVSLDNALPSSTNQGLNCAFAGDHVSLTLAGTGSGSSTLDPANLALGMIVCDPSQPVKVSKHFAAKLVVLNVETPITKGFACVLHYGGVTEAAVLKKLVAQVSKGTGEILKRKPRILAKNSSAQVSVLKIETSISTIVLKGNFYAQNEPLTLKTQL